MRIVARLPGVAFVAAWAVVSAGCNINFGNLAIGGSGPGGEQQQQGGQNQVGGQQQTGGTNPTQAPVYQVPISGTARFPSEGDAKVFVAVPDATVDIFDLKTRGILATVKADASGAFALTLQSRVKAEHLVVGVRVSATRAAAYRIAATLTLTISGLAGGTQAARIDPISTIVAAKILQVAKEATGSDVVSVDVDVFKAMVEKVQAAVAQGKITADDLASVTKIDITGAGPSPAPGGIGASPAPGVNLDAALDLFGKVAAEDSTLGALLGTAVVISTPPPAPGMTAPPSPGPSPYRTPGGRANVEVD
ncbi:MAG: hypothetical protein FJZ01_27770 [Candidatus Sericytochromatia bacterium]|nr:hypothetical protein [Candidatus Tanganyikabacteria bacterium]